MLPTHITLSPEFTSLHNIAAILDGNLLLMTNVVLPHCLGIYQPLDVAEDFEMFAVVTGELVDVVKDKLKFQGRLTREEFVNRLLNVYDITPENFEEFAV